MSASFRSLNTRKNSNLLPSTRWTLMQFTSSCTFSTWRSSSISPISGSEYLHCPYYHVFFFFIHYPPIANRHTLKESFSKSTFPPNSSMQPLSPSNKSLGSSTENSVVGSCTTGYHFLSPFSCAHASQKNNHQYMIILDDPLSLFSHGFLSSHSCFCG